jgi:hypothetical protein
MRQQYRDLIALHGISPRDTDTYDHIEIGPANMYLLAADGRGPKLTLTEASFTGAVLYLAGHRDPEAIAGHHAMLHETLHTCGPLPDTGSEGAVAVEELVTELAAREVLRLTLSIAYDDAPLLAGSASKSGCYQDLIETAAAEFGGDRGFVISALAASALQIKREMQGMRGSYQVIGALLAIAGCDVVAGCSDRIVSAFMGHWTQTRQSNLVDKLAVR